MARHGLRWTVVIVLYIVFLVSAVDFCWKREGVPVSTLQVKVNECSTVTFLQSG
ncbi:hypothetical protein BDW75DRAFT_216386 [Aspergillus navahoensis]